MIATYNYLGNSCHFIASTIQLQHQKDIDGFSQFVIVCRVAISCMELKINMLNKVFQYVKQHM